VSTPGALCIVWQMVPLGGGSYGVTADFDGDRWVYHQDFATHADAEAFIAQAAGDFIEILAQDLHHGDTLRFQSRNPTTWELTCE
jgi:hypothetical protein